MRERQPRVRVDFAAGHTKSVTFEGVNPLTESRRSPIPLARALHLLLTLWMIAVLFLYWVAQGCPGIPAVAVLTAPLRDLLQQFFSAPYLG